MVLTNFELWAADGSTDLPMSLDYESDTRHLNPFDPRVVPQLNSSLNHLSSNGYYGFSYVNAAHETELNNNNNNNVNINRSNNSDSTIIANDVNGMNDTFTTATATHETHAAAVDIGISACAAAHTLSRPRCKKRFFVTNDDDVSSDCAGTSNKNYYSNNCEISAKRWRFDDDLSAQYCNEFFQLPSTQIVTPSCLMDTEEDLQQPHQQQQENQQLQVDVAMFENNNNNIEKYEQKLNPQLQNLFTHHHQQQHSQQQMQSSSQLEQDETQQQPVFHQQQHYQDPQFATINCHLKHNNNCDTLALNNNHSCKINLEQKIENVLKNHKQNSKNKTVQGEHDKYDNDDANKLKVDDATLFAELHGGYLHHHDLYIHNH